jgi:uncharacterized protein YfkK (UPF0435 family)
MAELKEHQMVYDKLQELCDVIGRIGESAQSLRDGVDSFKQLATEVVNAIKQYNDVRYKELQDLHNLIKSLSEAQASSVPRDSINDGDLYRLMDLKDDK